jgi:hypothetical protein
VYDWWSASIIAVVVAENQYKSFPQCFSISLQAQNIWKTFAVVVEKQIQSFNMPTSCCFVHSFPYTSQSGHVKEVVIAQLL